MGCVILMICWSYGVCTHVFPVEPMKGAYTVRLSYLLICLPSLSEVRHEEPQT